MIVKEKIAFFSRMRFVVWILVGSAFAPFAFGGEPPKSLAYFEENVRPLLIQHCLECHSRDSEDVGGNLFLDSREGWMRGGELGPAIVPGNADASILIQAIKHTHAELRMPPDQKLSKSEVRILVDWVEHGATDPRTDDAPRLPLTSRQASTREHWAFQSPDERQPELPSIVQKQWVTNEVDLFVLAELERRGLVPVKPADKYTLIRRLTFDLHGLPPTPDEVRQFIEDESHDAFEKLVDRLLSSPRYGERWGRFWLDVARYADSNGLDENIAHGNAWRYRDYVIRSWNQDKPFDHFVTEQLAGDLMPPVTNHDVRKDRLVATGFLSLGPKVLAEVDETKMEMDIVDEQVETVGRAFMGLTIGCARCHDHKFDPISTEDYYALAGIFKSTKTMEHFTKIARWREVSIAPDELQQVHAERQREIADEQKRFDELSQKIKEGAGSTCDKSMRQKIAALKKRIADLQASQTELPMAMSVADYEKPTELRVHIRGSHLTQGKLVPRGVPRVLENADTPSVSFEQQASGRLQLARWLTNNRHPLVARVIVNRIWRWHFGVGLVASTDNFGLLGERPRNQPLLDWLAVQLVKDDWSLKQLHRRIVLSSTYRLSNAEDENNIRVDNENRFQWRAKVRRLEAEAVRDAMLFVGGELDQRMGGSQLHVKNREFLFDHTSKDKTKYDSHQRSVYLPVIRNHLYDVFQLFDYADASVMTSDRPTTTVAPQSLFMMNSNFSVAAAKSLASRILSQDENDRTRVESTYWLVFGRPTTLEEQDAAVRFLNQIRASSKEDLHHRTELETYTLFCHALLMSNEFIHVR